MAKKVTTKKIKEALTEQVDSLFLDEQQRIVDDIIENVKKQRNPKSVKEVSENELRREAINLRRAINRERTKIKNAKKKYKRKLENASKAYRKRIRAIEATRKKWLLNAFARAKVGRKPAFTPGQLRQLVKLELRAKELLAKAEAQAFNEYIERLRVAYFTKRELHRFRMLIYARWGIRTMRFFDVIKVAQIAIAKLEKERAKLHEKIDAIPPPTPIIVGYIKDAFDRALRDYVKHSRLSAMDAVNKKLLNVAIKGQGTKSGKSKERIKRSLATTQLELDRKMIRENLAPRPDFRPEHKFDFIPALRAFRIYWARKGTKSRPASILPKPHRYYDEEHPELKDYIPKTFGDAERILRKKMRRAQGARVGWYKLGFLDAAGMIAPHVKGDKFRRSKIYGAGAGYPAKKSQGNLPWGYIRHKAPWAIKAAARAGAEALASEATDMQKYLKKKMMKYDKPIQRVNLN